MSEQAMRIRFEGRVSAGTVLVEVDGQQVAPDSQGRFTVTLALAEGARSLGFTSITSDGRRSTRRVQIRRQSAAVEASA